MVPLFIQIKFLKSVMIETKTLMEMNKIHKKREIHLGIQQNVPTPVYRTALAKLNYLQGIF
jgi:hypothetical protein